MRLEQCIDHNFSRPITSNSDGIDHKSVNLSNKARVFTVCQVEQVACIKSLKLIIDVHGPNRLSPRRYTEVSDTGQRRAQT